MAEQSVPAKQGCPGWVRGLLVASLALNLLIVGAVIGAVVSGGGPGHGRDVARETRGTPFVRALSPDDRRKVVRGMVAERRSLREGRDDLRDGFEGLLQALRADSFDEDAIRGSLERQRQAMRKGNEVGEKVLVARLAEMTAEERRAYADRLEAQIRRRPRR